MKNSAEWKGYSEEIQHTVSRSSIQWMLILVFFFQGIITIYLNIDVQPLKSTSIFALVLIVISLLISSTYLITDKYRFVNFYSCSLLLTAAQLSISFIIYEQWQAVEHASDLLVIAFICSILANYSNFYLLLLTSVSFTAAYVLLQSQLPLNTLDWIVSVSKFPVIFFLFIQTFRKMLTKGQYHVVKNEILKRKLYRLSVVDDLTQIQNRKGFRLALASSLASAQRFNLGFTLLILDVDYFKQYNDSLGHPAGDQCLIRFADTLNDNFQRETDIVTRLGGEEFAILVPNANWYTAEKICQRIHETLAYAAIVHPSSPISKMLTVSIGGAIFKQGDDETSIYARADKAVYQAKSAGRNCSVILGNEEESSVVGSDVERAN